MLRMPVDNEFFMREDETRNELALQKRTELGIPTDATVFLFVGKLEPKGSNLICLQKPFKQRGFVTRTWCSSVLVSETKLKVQCASARIFILLDFKEINVPCLFGTELEMSCASRPRAQMRLEIGC